MKLAAQVKNLRKDYHLGTVTVEALRGVSIDVPKGDLISIMGASGSGKSTLLNLLGCLDRATAGEIWLGDQNVSEMSDDRLSEMRASEIGLIFQSYNLIPQLTVIENIEVPLYYQGTLRRENHEYCRHLADLVGLGDRIAHRPYQLSGGQQQRVAVARSLANQPQFVLADEPTGNLDSKTTQEILALLTKLNEQGTTIIIVTHEAEVANMTRRRIHLTDGLVDSDTRSAEFLELTS